MDPGQDDKITKEFLRGCLDHASAAVYAKDQEGRYLFFNRRFFELFGIDVLGKTDYDLFDSPTAETFRTFDRKVMEQGTAIDGEEVVPSREGERIYWSVKFPLRDADGKVYGVGGISSDITERKEAERERDATLALLDTFLSRSPVGFAVFDRELRYVRLNQTLAEINGFSVEEHLGRRVPEIVPEAAGDFEAAMRAVLLTGHPVVNSEVTVTTRAMPGVQRSFLVSFYPISIGGETTALGGVLSEITEQKRAAEQLRRDAELRELFVAVLAHDLRTPLSSISMSANALVLREDTSEFGVRAAQRILRSAQRMNVLIGQVLDFTRARADGGLLIQPTPLDLTVVCSALVEELRAAHPDRIIEMRAVGDLLGSWDCVRLGQLLGNLLQNALRHGAPETPVFVTLEGRPDHVRLSVQNQGPAIPQEFMDTLFEPFHRGKSPLKRGAADGLGLGLYISERIVASHGGRIRATSDDKETVFLVELPRTSPTTT